MLPAKIWKSLCQGQLIRLLYVPVVEWRRGNLVKVTVGQHTSPMTEEHHIQFIIAET